MSVKVFVATVTRNFGSSDIIGVYTAGVDAEDAAKRYMAAARDRLGPSDCYRDHLEFDIETFTLE